ncbi:putative 3-hydroxyisobutyrate dehydrogenase [Leucobacter aridicollis]|uniref:NAD(P)-dependent oxidoreductase n=1 Tax=Leucobacter aridicollis TaxID=283878 RepID=UPI0037CA4917
MATIAWIGLGNMGSRMSAHLIAAGHTVLGVDPSAAALEQAVAAGVTPAASVAEAVAGADAVITMLPKGEHVRQVYEGPDGVWEHTQQGAVLFDSSTVDIETSQWCHTGSAERGFAFVDAPVSGGTAGASDGTLAFMLGGAPQDVERVRELIGPMAGNVFATGGPTTGIAAKIVNNMMLFIAQQASAEGSQLALQLGLDPQVFWDVVSASSGRSWAQQTWYPVPGIVERAAANQNFDATFSADLARKDIGLAVQAGADTGVSLPGAHAAMAQLDRLIDEGLGHKDSSLVVKYSSPDGTVAGYAPEGE